MTDYNDGKWHTWGGADTKPAKVHPESEIEFIWHDPETDNVGRQKRIAGYARGPSWGHVLKFRVVKEHREPRELWLVLRTVGVSPQVWEEDPKCKDWYGEEIIHVSEVMEYSTPAARVAALLRMPCAFTAPLVAVITNMTQAEAQKILRAMDEAGDLFMKNGFYRASETFKAKVAGG